MDEFYSLHARIFRDKARMYARQARESADPDYRHNRECLRQACLSIALRLDTAARLESGM